MTRAPTPPQRSTTAIAWPRKGAKTPGPEDNTRERPPEGRYRVMVHLLRGPAAIRPDETGRGSPRRHSSRKLRRLPDTMGQRCS